MLIQTDQKVFRNRLRREVDAKTKHLIREITVTEFAMLEQLDESFVGILPDEHLANRQIAGDIALTATETLTAKRLAALDLGDHETLDYAVLISEFQRLPNTVLCPQIVTRMK